MPVEYVHVQCARVETANQTRKNNCGYPGEDLIFGGLAVETSHALTHTRIVRCLRLCYLSSTVSVFGRGKRGTLARCLHLLTVSLSLSVVRISHTHCERNDTEKNVQIGRTCNEAELRAHLLPHFR